MLRRPTKITVRLESVRNEDLWRVRFRDAYSQKIARRFFHSRKEADKFAEALRERNRDADGAWAMLNGDEKSNVMAVWREARRRNVDLMAAVIAAEGQPDARKLGKVIAELVVAKRNAGRDKDYVDGLENILNRFAAGREAKPVAVVDSKMVAAFLESLPVDSRTTVRSRLSTLFNFAVRHGYLVNNPCARLERVSVVHKLPVIMSPEEAVAAVEYLVRPPVHRNLPRRLLPKAGAGHEALAWFLLTTFAALRPEEAQLCDPKVNLHLDAEKPFVEITPEITKTGNWRIVYPRPEVVVALRWALDHGSILPLDQKRKARAQQRLAAHLGWAKWKQDVTRRSAASYWLALTNDLKLMVEMLGNSEAIFKRHYKKPVPHEQAVKFFGAVELVTARGDSRPTIKTNSPP